MSGPGDPPPPDWDVTSGSAKQFNNAQSAAVNFGYDSKNLAIYDSSGVDNYFWVGISAVTSGHVAWFFGTITQAGNAVYCQIPLATFNVIKNGSLNTSTGVITYSGHTYQILLDRDQTSGHAIAYANQLT